MANIADLSQLFVLIKFYINIILQYTANNGLE